MFHFVLNGTVSTAFVVEWNGCDVHAHLDNESRDTNMTIPSNMCTYVFECLHTSSKNTIYTVLMSNSGINYYS